MRNRLLSRKVYLHMGRYQISVQHLHELIESSNKIDTNLCKSDLLLKDKQNFSACQKICNDKVLDLLSANNDYNGTYAYLLIINLLIVAYTESGIPLATRIFYGWIVLFFIRLWRLWLFKSRKTRRKKTSDRSFFITSNALLSIELNAHTLIFICLLIDKKIVPESVADSIHLFSSQPCESIFRDARSLSGVYSTRINFTIKQFLQRINKLNALTEIKQFESTNDQAKIVFPVHHKVKRMKNQNRDPNPNPNPNESPRFDLNHIETIILCAYDIAQEIVELVGMDKSLIKHKLFDIEDSSKMSKHLLQLNTLTESEILILDNRDYDSDEEEDGFIGEDEGEQESDDDNDDDDEIDFDDYQDYDDNNESNASQSEHNDEEEFYHDDPSDDDHPSTASFENVQSTTYSGVYYY